MKPKTKQKRNWRRKKAANIPQVNQPNSNSNLIYPKTNAAIVQDYDHGQWSLLVLNAQSIKKRNIDYGLHH